MDSANVWRKLDKNSIAAEQVLAELFIASGNLTKAKPLIENLKSDLLASRDILFFSLDLSFMPTVKFNLKVLSEKSKSLGLYFFMEFRC